MLTITEKDGATIITIENPSASEQDIIKKAKNAQRVSAWVNGASKAQPAKASTPSTTSAPAAEKPSSWGKPKQTNAVSGWKSVAQSPAKNNQLTEQQLSELGNLGDFEEIISEGELPF